MKLKALVIDDSLFMRKMIMRTLANLRLADFDFVEAEDGVDGLAKWDPEMDIAFVDWNLPRMTGIDFVRQLRNQPGAKRVTLVMVSSKKTESDISEALGKAGADAYIPKPFTPEEMENKLRPLIGALVAKKSAISSLPS